MEPLRLHRRHAVLNLQRAFDEQVRRADTVVRSSVKRSGRTMMLAMPVSSSSVRNTNPFAVPGRCRVMTAPATRTRRPDRPPAADRSRAARRAAPARRGRAPSDAGRSSGSSPRSPPARARRGHGDVTAETTTAPSPSVARSSLNNLPRRSHRPLDLPQRAAAIVAERIQRADLGERRQLVAAKAGAGDRDPRSRRSARGPSAARVAARERAGLGPRER